MFLFKLLAPLVALPKTWSLERAGCSTQQHTWPRHDREMTRTEPRHAKTGMGRDWDMTGIWLEHERDRLGHVHPNCSSLQQYWMVGRCHATVKSSSAAEIACSCWLFKFVYIKKKYIYIYIYIEMNITVVHHSATISILTATYLSVQVCRKSVDISMNLPNLHAFNFCWKPRNEWNAVNLVALLLHHSSWPHFVNRHKSCTRMHQIRWPLRGVGQRSTVGYVAHARLNELASSIA